jgi:methylase of polypeptide subunit release factors
MVGTETVDFGPLTIAFDGRVLRPRPWTARQSRWAAELIADSPEGPVLELCSGAGHIGLLAVVLEPRELVMVDASAAACELARRNVEAAGLSDRVEVRCDDLSTALADDERFAAIIADPPWVVSTRTDDYPGDPLLAIDGGADGLELARRCLDVIGRHLMPGGHAVLQVGSTGQAARLAEHVAHRPELGLRFTETRVQIGMGALVRIDRSDDQAG